MSVDLNVFFKEPIQPVSIPQKISKEAYLNLSSNEFHFPYSDETLDFINQTMENTPLFRYPTYERSENAFSVLCDMLPKEQFMLAAGSDDIIRILIQHILINCKKVYLQSPNYASYNQYLKLINADVEPLCFSENIPFRHNIDSLFESTIYEHSAIIIANPNGHSGQLFSIPEIENYASLAAQSNSLLVVDEAYIDFYGASCVWLVSSFNNLCVVKSLSKTHKSAGHRLGALIANEQLINHLKLWFYETTLSHHSLKYLELLPDLTSELKSLIDKMKIVKIQTENELAKHFSNWEIIDTFSNFSLIDVKDKILAAKICAYLKESGIYIKDYSSEKSMSTTIRFTISEACNMEKLVTELVAFKKVFM